MRTVSPVFGGAVIGVAVIVSLSYALGDSMLLMQLTLAIVGRISEMAQAGVQTAWNTIFAFV